MRNLLFISLYGINIDVIYLLVLFEHWYRGHCLDTNVILLFILFKHKCCMSICVVYTQKLYTWLSCLNNAQHSCLINRNLWTNRFRTNLKRIHEACKFVMLFYKYQFEAYHDLNKRVKSWSNKPKTMFNNRQITTLLHTYMWCHFIVMLIMGHFVKWLI